jgi:hypothetical protein
MMPRTASDRSRRAHAQLHRYRRSPEVVWRSTPSGIVVLPPGEPEPLLLEGTGNALWEVLEKPVTLDAAAQALAGMYDVEPGRVSVDIRPIIDVLVRRGVIVSGN